MNDIVIDDLPAGGGWRFSFHVGVEPPLAVPLVPSGDHFRVPAGALSALPPRRLIYEVRGERPGDPKMSEAGPVAIFSRGVLDNRDCG